MPTPISRIIIYARKMPEMIDFYCRHFGFSAHQPEDDRIVELRPASGGLTILLHPAGKGQKQGQAIVKLVFDVDDVERFCRAAKKRGLDFGPIHRADGYSFANARDPSGNPVSVSSRAFSP